MTLQAHLANLRSRNLLTEHTATQAELEQHLANATELLADARNGSVSGLGRFHAAYSASHSLLTAAIKMQGLRPGGGAGHRQILFDLLDQLLPAAAGAKPMLSQAHVMRNRAEYDGQPVNATAALVQGLVDAAANVDEEVRLAYRAWLRARGG
jgi:hypothetical protein